MVGNSTVTNSMSAGRAGPQANSESKRTSLSRLVELVQKGDEIVFTRSGRPVATLEPTTKLPRTFLDSNVLVYGDDHAEPVKRRIALDLIREHRKHRTGVVSLQVLQEYFVTVTRKHKLDSLIARNKVEIYSKFHVSEPTLTDVLAAIDLHRLHSFSLWDALIIRAASKSGCRILLSEDMQHGREIEGVRIVNPFL